MTVRPEIYGAVLTAILVVSAFECAAGAIMKQCPIDKTQMANEIPCPKPGGELRNVTVDTPQRVHFCSICKKCWAGILLEAGETYRIRIIGEPDTWADGGWQATTAEDALKGWGSLSDIPGTAWWEHVVKGPLVWWGARSRRILEADWFHIFFVIRDTAGTDTKPVRLEKLEQAFKSPVRGELYFFANDHPDYYEKNNTGRMSLEVSLAN